MATNLILFYFNFSYDLHFDYVNSKTLDKNYLNRSINIRKTK